MHQIYFVHIQENWKVNLQVFCLFHRPKTEPGSKFFVRFTPMLNNWIHQLLQNWWDQRSQAQRRVKYGIGSKISSTSYVMQIWIMWDKISLGVTDGALWQQIPLHRLMHLLSPGLYSFENVYSIKEDSMKANLRNNDLN